MKNVIITGATGMIGGIVLDMCLENDEIGKVTSIVRRATGKTHDKLVEVIHKDFLDYSSIESHFDNQDICYFCIGVYTGAVPRDKFREITIDYTKVFAELLRQKNEKTSFCFLSGQGADTTEKSRVAFAKDKGIAENILKGLNFESLHIFRPGYIYPVTPRKEPNFTYSLMRSLYKPISAIYPNIGLTSVQLATGIFVTGLNGGEMDTYENMDIRKLTSA